MTDGRPDRRPDTAEVDAILRLLAVPGLGATSLRRLLLAAGSAAAAARAAAAAAPGLRAAIADPRVIARARRWRAVLQAEACHIWMLGRPDYPARLLHLADPPPVVFACGRTELITEHCVAIVGTRRCTAYGADTAALLAAGLTRAGAPIVSGLARGIDAIAHEAALTAGGTTIAVLGTGIDVAYPRENAPLQSRIRSDGLLLTEYPPGTDARRHHFVARNRLIAALAHGVIVVEAGADSGALHTAEFGLDLGREVFAVPGPIGRPESLGTNRLLQDGARVITEPADAHIALGFPPPSPAGPAPRAETDAVGRLILQALHGSPLPLDDIATAAGVPAADALVRLLDLEMLGAVHRLPGARFAAATATEATATGTTAP